MYNNIYLFGFRSTFHYILGYKVAEDSGLTHMQYTASTALSFLFEQHSDLTLSSDIAL